MTPDSHIKQHTQMFRAAEGGLDDFRKVMNSYNHSDILSSMENCHLYILCMLCNACSIIKNYSMCDQRWEEIFITGNIYVLINESIKKIIGFKSKKGVHKQSLMDLISLEIKEPYKESFESIRKEFLDYADDDELQSVIHHERNTSVHFDEDFNALNLFRFLTQRNAQAAFNQFIKWFSLMYKLNALLTENLNNGTEQDK
jgi:hypothetical protein